MIICGFNNQMLLHLSSFDWNAAQTDLLKWFERSDLYPSRMRFRGHLHLVFSGSDSYPNRKKRMK